jgi:hypothetical protein
MDNDDAELIYPVPIESHTLETRPLIDEQVKEVLDDKRIPPPRYDI